MRDSSTSTGKYRMKADNFTKNRIYGGIEDNKTAVMVVRIAESMANKWCYC